MKKETNIQIDKILRETEHELSSFEKSVRPALNSPTSEFTSKIFEIFFEPKTFALSMGISLSLFYVIFFSSLMIGQEIHPELIISFTLFIYPTLRLIKFIKDKIR